MMSAEVHYAILRTLSYFHVFRYPLTVREIWRFLPVKCKMQDVEDGVKQLAATELVFQLEEYYSLEDNIALAARRKAGNKLGLKKLRKANRIAHFLGMFPFVESVCISGSLSKEFALEDSDLDFFIITAPGRLWTARNFMHLFRKLTFLLNAQDSFCMNYYMSLAQPQIYPRNFYTAVEFSTLKAAYVHKGLDELIMTNKSWISLQLPNMDLESNMRHRTGRKNIFTALTEAVIDALGGDKIESWFYKTTMQRWEKKWAKSGYDVYKCMLSAGPHVNTPINYPVHLPNEILQKCEDIFANVSRSYKLNQAPMQAIRA